VIFSSVKRQVDGIRYRWNSSVVFRPKLFGKADSPKGIHHGVRFLKPYFIGRVSRRHDIRKVFKQIRSGSPRLNSDVFQQLVRDATILCSFEKPLIG